MSRNIDALLAHFVSKKYAVSALGTGADVMLTGKGCPAGLLALKLTIDTIETSAKDKKPNEITSLVSDFCKETGIKYYSIIVYQQPGGGFLWNIGNINLDEIDQNKIATITVKSEPVPAT